MQRTENQWESELNIISSIQVVIPVKLYLVCNQIAGKVGGNEFSIVTDIKEKEPEYFTHWRILYPKAEG